MSVLLEPKDILQKLEFDKVVELLLQEVHGNLGEELIQTIQFSTDTEDLQTKLKEVAEYKLSLEKNDKFPLAAYEDIREDVKMLLIEDYVLSIESIQHIHRILSITKDIFKFFSDTRRQIYPSLLGVLPVQHVDSNLAAEIDKVIDEKGEIRSDASPELARIRKQILSTQKELEKEFRSIVQHYRSKGYLTDTVESYRNGRRVLSVPAEHKRQVRGIIHDESATGRTAFIEPENIIEINNDLFDLEQDEKREIYKILKALCNTLRPYAAMMLMYYETIGYFDFICSKARVALAMKANLPRLNNEQLLEIHKGYHPLLLLKNKKLNRVTIPFYLTLNQENRILILSGPNAGGKSITMKSVGLMQLMLQAGMLIPVEKSSSLCIFERFFADIGDSQSLEDDLSTYSSRLQNMKNCLAKANQHALVFIDEFGSGTDPKIGGAIAEAILRDLNFRKVYGVITTHYSNLKIFAFKNRGIINGSMVFDKTDLRPTYELKVGRPGSSYAFEIAEKTGLPQSVMKYARYRTGENEKAVDELLVDLQNEKKETEETLSRLSEKEKKLEKLIRNYDDLHKELEIRRLKIKLEIKEQNFQQSAKENKEFEKLIREIKEEKNLDRAKEAAAKIKEERQQLVEQIQDLREDIFYKPVEKKLSQNAPLREGDYVKFKAGGAEGKIETLNKNTAIVLVGMMRMQAKLQDLMPINEQLEINATKSVQTDLITKTAGFENKIDLRGMRKEEAMRLLENFVDKALMTSATQLEILHGKGDGILRNAVKSKLKEYKDIHNIYHPEENAGGSGITLVDIF